MPGINTNPNELRRLLRVLEVFEIQSRELVQALHREADEMDLSLEDWWNKVDDGDEWDTGDEGLDQMLREQRAQEVGYDLERVKVLVRRYQDVRDELGSDLGEILRSGNLAGCEEHLRLLITKLENYISGR
jgi:tRNA A37 N6-isopentenylltransferase MiaA